MLFDSLNNLVCLAQSLAILLVVVQIAKVIVCVAQSFVCLARSLAIPSVAALITTN